MQSPMGTQRKGILMPGVYSCIVKDQKCPIIPEFGKKKPVQTSPFNYLYDYCKQFTIMIAIPCLFG